MNGLIDSNQQLLNTDEIIQKYALLTNSSEAYPQVYQSIAQELQKPGTQFLRQGNTLFIIHYLENREGFFRALNIDTYRNFVDSSRDFIETAYKLGYDKLITEFSEPQLLQIFEIISRNPPNKDMGYTAEQLNTGDFRVTVALGPERGGA